MISFKQYLAEGKFRASPKLIHKFDVPMFSIFVESKYGDHYDADIWKDITHSFKLAKNKISSIGFPAMHVNAVFRTFPVGNLSMGSAHGNPTDSPKRKTLKYISLNAKLLNMVSNNDNPHILMDIADVIVHEWAHIWMFNNGVAFRDAVARYHEALVMSNRDKLPNGSNDKTDARTLQQLSDMVDFTGGYGLKSPDETWATAIDGFLSLAPYHRQRILSLMQIRGGRSIPNKRGQKYLKAIR